jgi:formate-dependent nitrite reductase cytochrome c552 subunit
MTCHSQVWKDAPVLEPVRESWRTGQPVVWNRVNDLPDFVFFNHSIHIAKGIGCVSCHGRMDKMPLTYKPQQFFMKFCLNCHRHVEKYIRPRSEVFNMAYVPTPEQQVKDGPRLVKEYGVREMITCYTCHR